MAHDSEKQLAGEASLRYIEDGQVVGLGTGSTATFAILALGERVRAGLKIRVAEIIGIRFDFRRHNLGKPFGFPDQSGRLGQNEYSVGIGVML